MRGFLQSQMRSLLDQEQHRSIPASSASQHSMRPRRLPGPVEHNAAPNRLLRSAV